MILENICWFKLSFLKSHLLNARFERLLKLFWQELQSESDICDVTLACEDKQIKTHKIIILKSDPSPHSFIYLIKDGCVTMGLSTNQIEDQLEELCRSKPF